MVVPILSLGGSGVISVWANIRPQQVHDMVASYLAHDYQAALRTQLDELELIHALFCEVNPIPVKAALAKMGLVGENYRQPLWPMADATRERLYEAMRGVGLID
jgi:4-hydroxy-tetrahydrodipicolinate synthase